MNIVEVSRRDAEDAWIEKYRKALDTAPIEPARRLRIDQILSRLSKNLAPRIGRLLDLWRRMKTMLLRRSLETHPAILQTPTATSKRMGALSDDTERTRMAS